MAAQSSEWNSWGGPCPPPPPPPSAPGPFSGNGGLSPFPPSPRPTVRDADDDDGDTTDQSCSESVSSSESDERIADGVEKATPNVGKPKEIIPGRVQGQGQPEVLRSFQAPERGTSLDVLTEIRKIIKEELGQIPSPSSPGATVAPDSAQPSIRPAIPNMSAVRPQMPIPSAPVQRSPPLQASSNAPQCTRPRPGVQWTDPLPAAAPPPLSPASSSSNELSAIDRKWGMLFDQNGVATKRWEQVVRGIGNYLMVEFLPQNSLVVTPGKLAVFYSHHKPELEVFPFAEIFRSRPNVSVTGLAELYQQLECEYYLVPAEPKSPPSVPGLTLTGWTRWMTLVVQAYPNEEAQRLANIFAALPINADNLLDSKPERLPKQISRHLLPERADRQARVLINNALRAHLERTQQPRKTSPSTTHPNFNPSSDNERRPSASHPDSPRTRYRPSAVPSPPCSQTSDDGSDRDHHQYHHGRRAAERDSEREDRNCRNGADDLRTYKSNSSVYRDPHRPFPSPPSLAVPPLSSSSTRSPLRARRGSSPPLPTQRTSHRSSSNTNHRHSVSGEGSITVGGGRSGLEKGYTWPSLPRSTSSSDERDRVRERERERSSRQVRERDRGSDRERERERIHRERERDREARPLRGREREREVEKERNRERERERDRAERRRERRPASVAGVPERRGEGSTRKTPVIVKNDREPPSRTQTWGSYLGGK
ncbi:hypothetical protein VTI28DRAFT_10418 [Corynascus sepedonium]